ncbi:ribosomal-protein-serine acetyltransferase [Marinithermofilum abyssi]|uniref:Ribosomal-protein-serine acetyltransferase n=1 Tax=Marinithermofilum abyssi TaxID=1571185 RepID=A0A8J2VDW3_9BACL|nr:GNAT family protein [Marinithermofilum abyssi]GGE19661.1 ribosomal-protein-serine acetyltransferase [Marinithermofilum abyssi]
MLTLMVEPSLQLRQFDRSHASALFQVIQSNRNHLRLWISWIDGIHSQQDAEAYILRSLSGFAGRGEAHFGIWNGPALVGSVTVERLDEQNHSAEIGYWLAQSHTGKGIMTKAVRTLIDYLFMELRLHRIEIRCEKENRASQAVPLRLGFRLEGQLRQAYLKQGSYVDICIYGLLAADWSTIH